MRVSRVHLERRGDPKANPRVKRIADISSRFQSVSGSWRSGIVSQVGYYLKPGQLVPSTGQVYRGILGLCRRGYYTFSRPILDNLHVIR